MSAKKLSYFTPALSIVLVTHRIIMGILSRFIEWEKNIKGVRGFNIERECLIIVVSKLITRGLKGQFTHQTYGLNC